MLAYVINLDRRTDRMAHMGAALSTQNIAFERISAVDGRLLGEEAINRLRLYPRGISHKLTSAQIGCYLSHIKAWKRFLETKDNLRPRILRNGKQPCKGQA